MVASIPLALLALTYGVWLYRRELRQAPQVLVIAGSATATLDGEAITELRLHWRGQLAFLRFREREGRLRHLSWWPDTLDTHARRELRLAVPVEAQARPPRSMAP
ncbi:hypothetical protein ACFOLC_12280 [Lysobacter cavernae]|uniref:DUF3301 domain-containing protein n=1 Tax=Lysobacter cavernae TaxID=1685901 RepID=A0ABV7RQY4_9GAMM